MLRRLVLGVAVALVALVLAGPAFMSAGRAHLAVTGSPADYGLGFEPITFAPPDRPITLRGWWLPADGARAAVILVHGGGEDNRAQPFQNGLGLMRDLVARHLAVLAFDMRNFGESDATPESSTFGDLEANDVIGAADAVAARAPGLPIAALGCSMGGATVVQAVARGARLGAVVTDSAFAASRDVAVPFVMAATGWPRLAVVPFVWSAEHLHGVPLGRGRTLEAARRVPPSVRALVIQNDGDPMVSVATARTLAEALPNAQTWITTAPAADHPIVGSQGAFGMHCQSYKVDPDAYVARVAAFLDAALPHPTQ